MKPYVHQSFWSDSDMELQPPEIKLAALWLITNSQTSILGLCSASDRRFCFETGLPSGTLSRVCEALPRAFKPLGDQIFITNFIRHQFGAGSGLMRNNWFKALAASFLGQSKQVQDAILELYPEFEGERKGLPSPSKGFKAQGTLRNGTERTEGGSGDVNNFCDLNPPEPAPIMPGDPVRDALRKHAPFVAAWKRWKQHSEEAGKSMTSYHENSVLLECGRQGPDRAIEVIDWSISKGAKNLIWDDAPRKRSGRALGGNTSQQSANPAGWVEWRNENYPGADKSVPYSQISPDIQREFETYQKRNPTPAR
jgi:hypothetical protein